MQHSTFVTVGLGLLGLSSGCALTRNFKVENAFVPEVHQECIACIPHVATLFSYLRFLKENVIHPHDSLVQEYLLKCAERAYEVQAYGTCFCITRSLNAKIANLRSKICQKEKEYERCIQTIRGIMRDLSDCLSCTINQGSETERRQADEPGESNFDYLRYGISYYLLGDTDRHPDNLQTVDALLSYLASYLNLNDVFPDYRARRQALEQALISLDFPRSSDGRYFLELLTS